MSILLDCLRLRRPKRSDTVRNSSFLFFHGQQKGTGNLQAQQFNLDSRSLADGIIDQA